MRRDKRLQVRIAAGLAIASAVLSVLTFALPDWIEVVVGVDPDSGSGAVEWIVAAALLAVAFAAASAAGALQIRAVRAREGARP